MARRLQIALGAVGALLVLAAVLVKWVAAPALVEISLDDPSVTVSEGDATYLGAKIKVVATRTVVQDDKASTGDVAVWDETLCLVNATEKVDKDGCAAKSIPDSLPLKSTDRVAIDRQSAEAVDDTKFNANINGRPVTHEGVDYTFPLATEKKTYKMFDANAGKAYEATFAGEESIKGVDTYKFDTEVKPDAAVTIIGAPATYYSKRSVWVEPTTGVIVKGVQQITERLGGTPVFEGTVTFTDKTQQQQADFAKDQKNKIALIRWWIPAILLAVGVVMVAVAWFVGRRKPPAVPAQEREPLTV
jgi:hypothetical protein